MYTDKKTDEATHSSMYRTVDRRGSSNVISKRCCTRCTAILVTLLSGMMITLIGGIYIGAHYEGIAIAAAPQTLDFYLGDTVCAISNPRDHRAIARTYPTAAAAHEENQVIVHCRECGACSTPRDMEIMSFTRKSLTLDSTMCAFLVFLEGPESVSWCLEKVVGFTRECEQCWTNDVVCSFQNCKYTCIKHKFIVGEKGTNDDDTGILNPCLNCDEKICGPAFIQCSGANRRRMGIVSDIERSGHLEQCIKVDYDWMKGARIIRDHPS